MSDAVAHPLKRKSHPAGQRAGAFEKIANRLRQRPDTEHEVALNRLVLGAGALASIYCFSLFGDERAGALLRETADYFIVFNIAGILILGHILWRPGVSVFRRAIGIPLDIANVCYLIHVGGETTAFLYPVLLWTIFGNGFRFGIPYLRAASVVGLAGFAAVVATTEIWRTHLALSGGLLAGLVILPAYVSVLIRKLSEAKRIAEEASRSKSLFLASISHELRTPLNAIIGFSELLTDTPLDEEQVDMTQTIGHSGRSLLALINSILDFSRFEVGKMPITRESIDLFAFLNDIRDMLSVQARAKSIRLGLHIGSHVPHRVLASRRLFEEVLINLAGNAVKFTAEGHVLISVECLSGRDGHATLRFEVADTGIGIAPEAQARIFESFTQADASIIDRFGGTGLGLAIAKQQVEAQGGSIGVESTLGVGSTFWFEMEFAVERGGDEAIAPDIPVLMLGTDDQLAATLESAGAKLGRFSCFDELEPWFATAAQDRMRRPIVFLDERCSGAPPELDAARLLDRESGHAARLVLVRNENSIALTGAQRVLFATEIQRPITRADVAAALAIASGRGGKPGASTDAIRAAPTASNLHVLVAEDNRTNQKVIAKVLERAGHRVRLVDNGQEALDALAERPFDIVLMDVNMPVLNGIEATRRYRAASIGQEHIPILALTADATAEASARCAEAGMDGCVTKPIEPAKLIELIGDFCSQGPRADTVETEPDAKDAADLDGPGATAAIDADALSALEKLGGRDFVKEIVLQFVGDAATVLRGLSAAVTNGDLELFRDRAHALRSCAANVGAQTVYKLCLSWRELEAQEFALHGAEYMEKLEAEFEQARSALEAYLK